MALCTSLTNDGAVLDEASRLILGYLVHPLIAESVLWGLGVLLFILSTYILVHGGLTTLPHKAMLGATALMLTTATIHWVFGVIYVTHSLRKYAHLSRCGTDDEILEAFVPSQYIVTAEAISFLGDSLVLWRACELWGRNRVVIAVSVLLLICNIVFGSLDVSYRTVATHQVITDVKMNTAVFGLAILVNALVSNLWATGLVAFQAWQHRCLVRDNLAKGSRRTTVEKILALLTESGAIYCVIWVFFIATTLSSGLGVFGFVVSQSIPQVIAIYPTVIVVIIALRKTYDPDTEMSLGPIPLSTFVAEARRPATSMDVVSESDRSSASDANSFLPPEQPKHRHISIEIRRS
ncbi:hypothetical protein OF83DRAFT_1172152 [Amylostereum chailletii]|nr:hypothetical protein OF83DRAFT_1172152 [Amylostereum chailletii]